MNECNKTIINKCNKTIMNECNIIKSKIPGLFL
jgi:hypothetical protein